MAGHSASKNTFLSAIGIFAASGLVTTTLQLVIRMGKNVLFTRMLGPEGRGLYSLLMAIPSLVISFGNLGFGLGSLYLATKKKVDLRVLVGNSLAYSLVHGLVLLGVGAFIFHLRALGLFSMEGAEILKPFVLIAIPLLLFQDLGLGLVLARTDIHFYNLLRLVFSLLPVVIFLALLIVADPLTAVLCSWVVSVGTIALLAFGRLFRNGAWPVRFSVRTAILAFQFGLRGSLGQFSNSVVRRVDLLFLAHFCSADVVGQYAVAVSLAEILLTLPEVVSVPFLPMRLDRDNKSGGAFSPFIFKYILLVMTVVCLFTVLLARPAIWILFGRNFSPSFMPLVGLLPGILALSLYEFTKAEILAMERPEFISYVSLGAMLLNVALNFVFIPLYGATGAACSSSVCYMTSCAVLLVVVCRHRAVSLREMLFLNRADLSQLRTVIQKYVKKKRT